MRRPIRADAGPGRPGARPPDRRVLLEARPGPWHAGSGQQAWERVQFRVIMNNAARFAALLTIATLDAVVAKPADKPEADVGLWCAIRREVASRLRV